MQTIFDHNALRDEIRKLVREELRAEDLHGEDEELSFNKARSEARVHQSTLTKAIKCGDLPAQLDEKTGRYKILRGHLRVWIKKYKKTARKKV